MSSAAHTSFDLQTVALLREVLDDAWATLSYKERVGSTKSLLAERVLKAAAQGERDRARLVEAALQSNLAA
jgi:hypothetical protein